MKEINIILNRFSYIANNPRKIVEDHVAKGKKVFGCFPSYCPEEIVYALNAIPVGLWGGNIKPFKAKKYLPSFFCNILQECLELSINGTYNNLSGVIIPCVCDSLKAVGQNFKVAAPHLPFIPLVQPQNREMDFATEYLKCEYKQVTEKIEKITGNTLTDNKMNEANEVYNVHRKIMREFLMLANEYTDIITPLYRHKIVKSSYFIDKKEHTKMVKELIKKLKTLPKSKPYKKVGLLGIMMDSDEMLNYFDELNLSIAFDELLHETRQFRFDADMIYEDGLKNLCTRWQKTIGCSLLYDANKTRIDMILELIKDNNVDGVVICKTTFCDPEDYDLPFVISALKENGIFYTVVEIDDKDSIEKSKTKLQTFSEIIE